RRMGAAHGRPLEFDCFRTCHCCLDAHGRCLSPAVSTSSPPQSPPTLLIFSNRLKPPCPRHDAPCSSCQGSFWRHLGAGHEGNRIRHRIFLGIYDTEASSEPMDVNSVGNLEYVRHVV